MSITPSETPESPSTAPKVSPASSTQQSARSNSAILIVLLVLGAVMAGSGYWGWQQLQSLQLTQTQLQQQLKTQTQELQGVLVQQQSSTSKSELQSLLAGLDKRLANTASRLRNLESTDRQDWLLAEAEYLLRLANQRMLMERGTQGALALLENVDQLLRDLDNDDLFAVRQQLARDITALKLAPVVDRSGLYLQLSALAESIEQLPDLPSDMNVEEEPVPIAEAMLDEAQRQQPGVWQQLQNHFWSAMAVVGKHIRIRHHDQPIVPVLPPESSAYVRQNIRLMLERAQLAMLRENSDIYQHSVKQARVILLRYFATQERAQIIAGELESLAKVAVHTELPNIGGSLSALREHTDQLHKLDTKSQEQSL